MRQAMLQIVLADVSMSLDNVLAVAGAAEQHTWVLVIGLLLSVGLMGIAAGLVAGFLKRYPWFAYIGLGIILWVSVSMIYRGTHEVMDKMDDGATLPVAVPAGAPHPDIGTEAAVRNAVLAAPSIGYSTGPSGTYLTRLFERWGSPRPSRRASYRRRLACP